MATTPVNTFSGAALRTRDQRIEEKHQKELANLERKLSRSKATNDDLMKQLYDSQHRGNRLATTLGFNDLYEAQVYIDNSDDELSYKERSVRMAELEHELEKYKKLPSGSSSEVTRTLQSQVDTLKLALGEAKADAEDLLEKSKCYETKLLELEALQKRYDDISSAMDRAKARYARDYRSMKQLHRWLKCTDLQTGTAALDAALHDRKVARVQCFVRDDPDKIHKLFGEGMSHADLDKHLGITVEHELSSSATRVATPVATPQKPHPPSPSPQTGPLPNSSDTEGDAQVPSRASLSPAPTRIETPRYSAGRPTDPQTEPQNSRHIRPSEIVRRPTTDLPRPGKVRRTLGEDISEHSEATPVKSRVPLQDRTLVRETGNVTESPQERPLFPLFKGKAKIENTTPSSSVSTRNTTDYSVYKGRGRYAQAAGGTKPINSLYKIDPHQNGGVAFQYDEVVRGKDARKKLHGGDCECCRDYYDAIGPLPARPQPPLWRSPDSTPVKQRPSASPQTSKISVDRHKQNISRHRQQWVRGRTPPGYWNIGFPSTQEADEINLKAEEMHRLKQEQIEAEARKENGRYKRRDRDW
ncbi:hypothetical protein ONZ45_g19496 [Pleurotus djamor]|nr:hypothetical protein ONZ45_g19496 [Pleurotus djamor]